MNSRKYLHIANSKLTRLLSDEIGDDEAEWLTQMILLKQLMHKVDEEAGEFWEQFVDIRAMNKRKLLSQHLNGFDEQFGSDAVISLSYSDFSEEARLLLPMLYVADRVLHSTDQKRVFIFAGHAIDQVQAKFSGRELANYIL